VAAGPEGVTPARPEGARRGRCTTAAGARTRWRRPGPPHAAAVVGRRSGSAPGATSPRPRRPTGSRSSGAIHARASPACPTRRPGPAPTRSRPPRATRHGRRVPGRRRRSGPRAPRHRTGTAAHRPPGPQQVDTTTSEAWAALRTARSNARGRDVRGGRPPVVAPAAHVRPSSRGGRLASTECACHGSSRGTANASRRSGGADDADRAVRRAEGPARPSGP
jgi:hypothetical protein